MLLVKLTKLIQCPIYNKFTIILSKILKAYYDNIYFNKLYRHLNVN